MSRYLNIKSAVFTPVAGQGSAVTFKGCQSLNLNSSAEVIKGAGDGDRGPSAVDFVSEEPVLGLNFEDIDPAALAPLNGVRGTLVALVGLSGAAPTDATSGLKITFGPAVAASKGFKAAYKKYGDSDIEFHGLFVDGVSPVKLDKIVPGGN